MSPVPADAPSSQAGPPGWRRREGLGTVAVTVLATSSLVLLTPDLTPAVMVLLVPLAGVLTLRGGTRDGGLFTLSSSLAWTVTALNGASATIQPLAAATTGLAMLAVVLLVRGAMQAHVQDTIRAKVSADTSQTIMTRSTESIVMTDLRGMIVRANPAAERVLTDSGGTPLTGAPCHDRLSLQSSSGKPLDCSGGCALRNLCGDTDEAVEVWRPLDDHRQPLLASVVGVHDGDGGLTWMHSFRDITTLKQADEAKTMFLATASHELKTPLTVIRGFTQLLLNKAEDPQSRMALAAIESRSRELAAIVDRLLLSSRIDAGRVDLVLDTFDLSELLLGRLSGVGRSLGCHLVVRVEPGQLVHASEDALATVIEHLVDNAAKYSRNNGTITIHALEDGGHVHIEVADRGIGMTAEQAAHCFEKFWQAEVSDVRRFGGTGIGLYIVRSLVEGMNGTIEVRSAPGAGSVFAIRLPGSAPGEDIPAARPPSRAATAAQRFEKVVT